uniref:hypothetical protein n=1 Tax=Sedimenticola sp. TaxID=1940285 RepID=UPI003D0CACC4
AINTNGNDDAQGCANVAGAGCAGATNGQLNFQTGTLQVNALSNTSYSTSTSANIGAGSTVSIDASSDTSHSKTKTLGTIGEGNIQIANIDESDTKLLNRDVQDNEVDIYSIESHKGLKGSLDTRFLTEDGRKDIAEDLERSKRLGQAVVDVATKDAFELQDTFAHIDETQKELDVQKAFAQANGGKNIEALQGEGSTPEEKQAAIKLYAEIYAKTYGISIEEANIVATNKFVKGATYNQTGTNSIYINDEAQNNALDYANTMGHEVTHARINQEKTRDRGTKALNEEYASTMGEYAADGMEFSSGNYNNVQLSQSANTNTHTGNKDSELLKRNTQDFKDIVANNPNKIDFATANSDWHDYKTKKSEIAQFEALAQEQEAKGDLEEAQATREEIARLEREVAETEAAFGGTDSEVIANLSQMHEELDNDQMKVVVALMAAPALPDILAGMAVAGRVTAAEAAAFVSNPAAYCTVNAALCLSIAEEAGYATAGATTASSMVPHVPASGVRQAADEAVEAIASKADDVAKSAGYSSSKLQVAADSIQGQLTGPAADRRVTTVTQTADGRVVVSTTGGLPTPAQRAEAEKIFGEGNVEFVSGGKTTNATGPTGHHAEQRAIEYLGDDAAGSTQASSHYSCEGCAAAQSNAGVTNVTGNAADNGGQIGRPLNPTQSSN